MTMCEIRLLLHIQEEQEFILPTLTSAYAHSDLGHSDRNFSFLPVISSKIHTPFFAILRILVTKKEFPEKTATFSKQILNLVL
jgi:hypothetical protein